MRQESSISGNEKREKKREKEKSVKREKRINFFVNLR